MDHDSPEGASSTVAVIATEAPSKTLSMLINTPSITRPSPDSLTAFSSSDTFTVAEPAVDDGT